MSNLDTLERAAARWNAGDLDGYLNLYADDAVLHGYVGLGAGIAGIRLFYTQFWSAFPASQLIFDDVFAVDDRVACRFRVDAEHGGAFLGIPATHKRVLLPGITILRFENGQCVERWSQSDFLGLLTQIGAAPGS